MATKKIEKMWIRPAIIDVGPGRGLERARIMYQHGGSWRELKAEGELVPAKGPDGARWKRRLAEKGVEKFDPKTKPKTNTKTEAT